MAITYLANKALETIIDNTITNHEDANALKTAGKGYMVWVGLLCGDIPGAIMIGARYGCDLVKNWDQLDFSVLYRKY